MTQVESRALPLRTKLFFGLGQAAEGVKGRALETFLFFYYEQVLGLSAGLAAAALVIAVGWDAISDPLAGSISDATRSRWGRRHPYMYAAALPLAAFFVLLFSPPAGLGQTGLFVWLTLFSVLARTALTAYSVPHFALGAELSTDYDERTSVVAFRSWFQQIAAWSVVPVSFALFFDATPGYPNGQLNPEAYPSFAMAFAALMAIAILVSAAGTQDRIPTLPTATVEERGVSLRRTAAEMREALKSPSLRAYVAAILVFAVSMGLQRVLDLYMRTYYWGLDPDQILRIGLVELAGAVIGIPLFVRLSRMIDKKWTFIAGILLWGGFVALPPVVDLFGGFPDAESGAYLPLLAAAGFVAAFGSCGNFAVGGSLMADLVDEHELASGHRRAGILFGVINFASKFTPVAGISLATLVLGWAGIEGGVKVDEVAPESLRRLGLAFGPAVMGLTIVVAVLMSRYGVDRAGLVAIQGQLEDRKSDGI